MGTVITFSVNEPLKNRRRWVVYPKEINEEFDCSFATELKSIEEVIAESTFRHAVTLDVSSCFHHFLVSERVAPYFCFEYNQEYYQITTVPTGGRDPPAIAQLVTSALLLGTTSVSTTHIDNIRLGCDVRDVLDNDTKVVLQNARSFGIAIEVCSTADEYDFLGVTFSHAVGHGKNTAVQIASKTRKKVEASQLSDEITLRQVVGIFSRLVYCSAILKLPIHPYYLVYKFLRRRIGRNLDELADVWSCVKPILARWRITVLQAPKRFVLNSTLHEAATVLVTDASLSGWGAVAYCKSGVVTVAGPWNNAERALHINLLEFKALLNAITSMRAVLGDSLDILIDNTSVMHCIHRRRSNSFELNNMVGHLSSLISVNSVNYIQSAENEADPFSRLFGPN